MPEVGSLPEGQISCYVDTFGGRWDTTQYAAYGPLRGIGDDGRMVGANITLEFLPNKNVPHTDKIGLIQTVRSLKNGVVSLVPGLNTNVAITARTATTPDRVGLAIDRVDDPEPDLWLWRHAGQAQAQEQRDGRRQPDGQSQLVRRQHAGAADRRVPGRRRAELLADLRGHRGARRGQAEGEVPRSVEWGWTYAGGRGWCRSSCH
ncbi:hypothetical protein [Nannocystis sp.]|uniref:hypothetical protein n=1 Tax=Nannocystis sp. TaxID=1962667 RepID=UPI0025E3D247|nr:hypothetical protein [Nannocystis sp.]